MFWHIDTLRHFKVCVLAFQTALTFKIQTEEKVFSVFGFRFSVFVFFYPRSRVIFSDFQLFHRFYNYAHFSYLPALLLRKFNHENVPTPNVLHSTPSKKFRTYRRSNPGEPCIEEVRRLCLSLLCTELELERVCLLYRRRLTRTERGESD